MTPILKWPGGKAAELPVIMDAMPTTYGRYFEPFVGGGAVFFALEPEDAYVNDMSSNLIGLYETLGDRTRHDAFGADICAIGRLFSDMACVASAHASDFAGMRADVMTGADIRDCRRLDSIVADVLGRAAHAPAYVLEQGRLGREVRRNVVAKVGRMVRLEARHGTLSPVDLSDNYECALKASVYMAMRNAYNDGSLVGTVGHVASFYLVREYCYSSMFRYNKAGKFNVPYGGISYNVASLEHRRR